ncbi:MAG: hypothetical protein ACP5T0_04760 [Verrucomicrobiia bacterium]
MKSQQSDYAKAGIVLISLIFISALPVFSQTKGDLDINLVAQKVITTPNGKERLVSAEKAAPGDVILYTATYKNRGKGLIRELEPNLPIPTGTEFIPDSAKPKPAMASIDGKIFEPVPIKRKVVIDGKEVEKEVPQTQYRALRWKVDTLEAGKDFKVEARVKVLSK